MYDQMCIRDRDATSAVENPVACVITSISLDHMQYLGDTVAKIAGEKACLLYTSRCV